ncbi:hypothetical protein ACHQM5_009809 [Ranunculus cassubicifolius]
MGANLLLLLQQLVFYLFLVEFSPKAAWAIRTSINMQDRVCRNTVQGRYLLSDDNGHVCDALSLDPRSRCCPESGKKFSCHGCNLVSQCCNSYEFCVSCCTYSSVFDFCAGRCRHSSESVVHENAYISDFHHCFSLPTNSSVPKEINSEIRLSGITVLVGRQGESCDSVCKSKGQSCVPGKLLVLNKCEQMKKYMSCKGECIPSVGADQPAEVVEDAPLHLHPGACLYTGTQAVPTCESSHRHTRRLCPCA